MLPARRFYELHINGSSRLATQTDTAMAALWKIESDIRGLAPAARMAARQQRSATMVAHFADGERRFQALVSRYFARS
jgi:transposase